MTASGLGLHLVGGVAVGGLYFGSLWWHARLFDGAGRIRMLLTGMAVRFAVLGGVLTAASFEGAMPLLVTALGVLVARALVLRRAGQVTP